MTILIPAVLGWLWLAGPATEITGTVSEVSGDTVFITADTPRVSARPGDAVEIYFKIPGIDEPGKVGSGRVVGVDHGRIMAWIDRRTGTLAVGQIAKVQVSGSPAAAEGAAAVSEKAEENTRSAGSTSTEMAPAASASGSPGKVGDRWVLDDKTALDTRTHLMWVRGDFRSIVGRPTKSWYEASDWARQMNDRDYAGYHDWRLPSVAEYRTIEDKELYSSVFRDGAEYPFWARNEISKRVASFIGLFEGWATSGEKSAGDHPLRSARLVRRAR
jgi:hypothetical protein